MTDNPWKKIYDAIGEAAALEMVAEEAAELSAAASKAARIVRGENPARMTLDAAYAALREEFADVDNARDVLDAGAEGAGAVYSIATRDTLQYKKMTRWYKSLFGEEAEQCG